jgi:hypothetical protein
MQFSKDGGGGKMGEVVRLFPSTEIEEEPLELTQEVVPAEPSTWWILGGILGWSI